MVPVKRVCAPEKKTKAARLSKLQEHVSPRMEATNIIDFVTGALRFSVVSVLHLIVAAATMAFFVLSNVCRSVVIFSLFFRCHDLNGHKATRKRVSSRQPRLIVNLSVACSKRTSNTRVRSIASRS